MRELFRLGSALGLLLLAGCRDLDVPPPGPGVAPVVRFVSPDVSRAEGARVAQTLAVTLEAQDANGIRSLTLSCGATPLFNWTAPPFLATVDLRPCTVLAGADAGTVAVTLTARAVDGSGTEGGASVEVQVDATAPGLTVLAPPRVAPGQPFDVSVRSDRALAGVPLVSVEGVTVEARETAANTFVATVARAPLLGAETWDGGGPPPLALLEELERTVDVVVEARGQNGNAAPRVVARTSVSRIAWERSIPGIALGRNGATSPAALPQLPVATAAGLVVPVRGLDGQRKASWYPVQLRAAGGEVRTVPAEVLAADGGYAGAGIDLQGRVLLTTLSGSARYYDFDQGPSTVAQPPLPAGVDEPPVAVGEELCFSQTLFGVCTTLKLTCTRPDGTQRSVPLSAGYNMKRPNAMVSSGERVLLLGVSDNSGVCCTSPCPQATDMYLEASGASGYVNLYPGTAGTPPPVQRALALEAGGFALAATAEDFFTGTVFRFAPDGSLSQPWPSLRAVGGLDPDRLLTARLPGDQVLALTSGTTESTLWRHAPGLAPETAGVPAAFVPEDFSQSELEANSVRTAVGAAVLLRLPDPATRVGALMSTDEAGRPRWLYRYDRGDEPALIAGTRGAGLVYLVDLQRQRVVALYP